MHHGSYMMLLSAGGFDFAEVFASLTAKWSIGLRTEGNCALIFIHYLRNAGIMIIRR